MPPKNKVHVSVIQVREANENPISEPPEEEVVIIEPTPTGQQTIPYYILYQLFSDLHLFR